MSPSTRASRANIAQGSELPYVELHLHSYFSFLDGASSPEEMAARAAELGMPALAITDHQGLYGAVRFQAACRAQGIQPIFGAELHLAPQTGQERAIFGHGSKTASTAPDAPLLPGGHLTLLVESATGWRNLCRMISAAGLAGAKHHRPISWSLLNKHAEGLICLSGCREGVLAAPARRGDRERTLAAARALKQVFGPEHFYVELQRHFDAGDRRLGATLLALAQHLGLATVATNNVHYAEPDGFRMQHVMACIKSRSSLEDAGSRLYATPHRYLKSATEMSRLFADLPEAVARSQEIAARCNFDLDLHHARLPEFPTPEGISLDAQLRALCERGLAERYGSVAPASARPDSARPQNDSTSPRSASSRETATRARSATKIRARNQARSKTQAQAQLDKELSIIANRGLAGYFLVVHDIVQFANREGILCQGRGSAAGSIVAYSLGITPVDPIAQGLLFERFLSESSTATPDIDVDFAGDRREEVLQYVYQRYGQDRAGMVANVVTFKARSAVADVGKALGFPPELLEEVRAHLYSRRAGDVGGDLDAVGRFSRHKEHLPWRLLIELCERIEGFPRHLSIHSGGMLITKEPLSDLVPLEPATMPGRVVVQWDKDDVEDAGLIKIDLLSLRTLGMVKECFERVRAGGGPDLDLSTPPDDDPQVWAMMRAADTIGCFQVESRAQINLLPRLRPKEMRDLIIEVSLIRPGPVQGGMARAYLERRDGAEPVRYWHPDLEPILAETLGVLVFQEQVLRVAMTLAGFDGGQADNLRRAMSRKRSQEAMEALRADFVAGAGTQGIAPETANPVFDHLTGFAGYGFCKSHAAAFAQLSWVTCWLKCHHPEAFYCSLLNHQPMGFYSVRVVVEDARRHGLAILPIHVDRSQARWEPEPATALALAPNRETHDGRPGLRVPLTRLKGLSADLAERIVAEREARGPFASLWDFVRRCRPQRRIVERLVRVGALDGLSIGASPSQTERKMLREGGPQFEAGDKHGSGSESGIGSESMPPPDRRQLAWALGEMRWEDGGLDLPPVISAADLGRASRADAAAADDALLGLAQGTHPMALLRPQLADRGLLTSREIIASPDGTRARVAGRIEIVQRPGTAKGIAFISLEDETGLVNLILYPKVYARFRRVLRANPVVIAKGAVQHEHGAMHLIVTEIKGLEASVDMEMNVAIGVATEPGAPGSADAREAEAENRNPAEDVTIIEA